MIPTDIAGLKLWLKADALALSNNDPVATWADSSGLGNDATQSDSAKRPLYKTGVLFGRPAVLFDSSDDGMVTSLALPEPYTMFLVEKSLVADQTGVVLRTLNATTGNALIATNRWANGLSCYLNGIVSSYHTGDTEAHIAILRTTGTASTYWVDGIDRTTDSTQHSAFSNVAFGTSGAFAEPANTYVFEVVVFDSALSSTDRQGIHDYLNERWLTAPASTSGPSFRINKLRPAFFKPGLAR